MKKTKSPYIKTNHFITFLISAIAQIAFYLLLILSFEYVIVVLDVGVETPKKLIYAEAFVIYLISKVAKAIVDMFKKGDKDEEEDKDEDESGDDEDFF